MAAVLACLLTFHNERLVASGPMILAVAFWFIFARANRDARTLQSGFPAPSSPVVQVDLFQVSASWTPGWKAILLPALLALIALGIALHSAAHGFDLKAGWNSVNQRAEADRLDGPLGMGVGLLCAALILLGMLKTSIRLRTRMAQHTMRASLLMLWTGAALLVAVLVSPDAGVTISQPVARGFVILVVLGMLGITVWNQSRSSRFVPAAAESGFDDRWRWGLFYVNRNDPALFVQSRCGTGYSLNYGRMLAWPIALGMVVYMISMWFHAPLHR